MGLVENGNCDIRATIALVSYPGYNCGWLKLVGHEEISKDSVDVSNICS